MIRTCMRPRLRLFAKQWMALGAATLFLSSQAGAQTITNAPVTGVNIGPEISEILGAPNPAAAVNTYMAGIAATKVRWVRLGINWDKTQNVRSTIDPNDLNPGASSGLNWGNADIVIRAARNNGLKVLGLITMTPKWAAHPQCTVSALHDAKQDNKTWLCAPNPADYTAFALAAVKHYSSDTKGGQIDAWEVWNEPNCSGEFIPHDPAIYTQLLTSFYPAVKALNPFISVVAGGSGGCATSPMASGGQLPPGGVTSLQALNPAMLWDSRDWLVAMYANGAQGYFDALAHHPYCYSDDWQTLDSNKCPNGQGSWSPFAKMWVDFTSPSYGWPTAPNTYPLQSYFGTSLRAIMDSNGDASKTITFTEFGAPTTADDGATSFTGNLGGDPNKPYSQANFKTMSRPYLTQANQNREYQAALSWVSRQPKGQYGPIIAYCFSDVSLALPSSTNIYEPYFGLVTLGPNTALTGAPGTPKASYQTWVNAGTAAKTASTGQGSVPVGPGWGWDFHY